MTNYSLEDHHSHLLLSFTTSKVQFDLWEATMVALGEDHNHLILSLGDQIMEGDDLFNAIEKKIEDEISAGKSFIFVCKDPNILNFLDEDWPIVPTYQEALDFLEMEEIERKMGLR